MKKILAVLLSLTFSIQAFASGKVYIMTQDAAKAKAPQGALAIFSVTTPLEGSLDYLTISASASDGWVSLVKVHINTIRSLQMDVGSFMILTTSKDTNPIVMCLDAELINGSYFCRRLAINATTK